jgi:hypothetical protein
MALLGLDMACTAGYGHLGMDMAIWAKYDPNSHFGVIWGDLG